MKNYFLIICLLLVAGCTQASNIAAEPTAPIVKPNPSPTIQPAAATAAPTATSAATAIPVPTKPESSAADADVTNVQAVYDGSSWTFNVTVAHPDTGWEDYADGWDVVLPDGSVLKRNVDDPFTRLLGHPHETEQPFTRSQAGIVVPDDVTQLTVRAHDLVDGFGGREVMVDLTQTNGADFTVER